jgi:multiple sugar transport system permease protein
VERVLLFGVVQVPIMLALALVFALLLDSALIRGKTLFRLAYFVPFAIPSVVATLLWGYLYSPELSVISQIVRAFGWPSPSFFGENTLLWSIANIVTWEGTGYNMIVMIAALQAVPPDICEAAYIDGCSGWGIARHIKVPLLRPALVLTCVFSIIGTLQLFGEPQILSSMTAIDDSYTPTLYAYRYAFSYAAFNYSAAIAFVLALVSFVASYGFLRLIQRRQEVW